VSFASFCHASSVDGSPKRDLLKILRRVTQEAVFSNGDTPLMRAAMWSNASGVAALLPLPDARKKNAAGMTPLAMAAKNGNAKIVSLCFRAAIRKHSIAWATWL